MASDVLEAAAAVTTIILKSESLCTEY